MNQYDYDRLNQGIDIMNGYLEDISRSLQTLADAVSRNMDKITMAVTMPAIIPSPDPNKNWKRIYDPQPPTTSDGPPPKPGDATA